MKRQPFSYPIRRVTESRWLRAQTLAVAAYWLTSPSSSAALLDRGGGLIYDTVNDITWLQDANYAQTSGFHATGRMHWHVAMSWAAGLHYVDTVRNTTWSDWRLPRARETELSEPCYGYSCSTSEVGHLYHIEGIKGGSPGPFINFKPTAYWTGTGRAPIPGHAWTFAFGVGPGKGIQDHTGALEEGLVAFAWAVRDGDVANPPPIVDPGVDPDTPDPEPVAPPTPPVTQEPTTSGPGDGGGGGVISTVLLLLGALRLIYASHSRVRQFTRTSPRNNAL